ncbi:ATP-binding protein [Simkania negevensis]|uniref:ATP-binding protein n=1 Tax=Simkania negevensis TaxID=83561 RepID=A0ABS3AQU3_9BACT|nr:ATP-binding protein [Simkania negevensis]
MIYPAELTSLHPIIAAISQAARSASFSKQALHDIQLASEEAVVNIINHAYSTSSPNNQIDVVCTSERPKQLKITIIDKGKPFNPLIEGPEYNPNLPLQERQLGGIGLLLIRKLMTRLTYLYKKRENIFTMEKEEAQ